MLTVNNKNEIIFRRTPKQKEGFRLLKNEDFTEVLLDGGVRSGKTTLVVFFLLTFCLENPGVYILIGRRFFEHARKSLYLQTIEPMFAVLPSHLYKVNKADWIIRFRNGSQIWIGGFDDSKHITEIMGREYLMAFLNEAPEIEEEMVDKVITRLAQKVPKPGKKGQFWKPKLIFDCNPVFGEFYLNKRFEDINSKDKARLRWTTYDNKENLTEYYITNLEKSLNPQEKLRLMDGLWIGGGDFVYKNISSSVKVDSYDIRAFTHLVGGIDWGYTSAFNLWGIVGKKAVCLAELEAKDKITDEFLEEIIIILQNKQIDYKTFPVYCDHEPDRIKEAERKGFNAKNAYKDVSAGDSTVNWFDIGIHRDCIATYRSLQYLQNKKDRSGMIIDGKHIDTDSHSADASRYALHSYRMEYGDYIEWKDIVPEQQLIFHDMYKKHF